MKTSKSLSLVLGLVLTASLSACQKEKTGVYQPTKKIQQIYYSWRNSEKEPFQHWEWNGDKLSIITHYTDYDLKDDAWIENFTYENNRITRIDNYTHSEYITYDYDGDHLKSATVFYRNAIACTWAISYDGDKISKMTGTFFDTYKKDGAKLHLNPLSHLLPPDVCTRIDKCERQMAQQRHEEESYTIALLLTWTGDNISKIVFTGDGEYLEFLLQYDDKNCPLYGLMGGIEDYLVSFTYGHTTFSKNNVTSIIMKEDDYADTICFAYQYDSDKYPVLQTSYEAYDPDDKQVFYFEY
ncbi:MAG: hypothetical protein IJP44_06655 [Bacteroidales bacterium]|nr:hypothetical protein [Bacteroidales bacterium]